ncbi:unnamed protein product, partial [Fusarium graminearum]
MSRPFDTDEGRSPGQAKRRRLDVCLSDLTELSDTDQSRTIESHDDQSQMDYEFIHHTQLDVPEDNLSQPIFSPDALTGISNFATESNNEMPNSRVESERSDDVQKENELPQQSGMDQDDVVCFGTVCGVSATYNQIVEEQLPTSFKVNLDTGSRFSAVLYKIKGRIPSDHSSMVESLLGEKSLKLHTDCVLYQRHEPKKKGRLFPILPCSLNITVYGPLNLFGEIGKWFQEDDIYLQDPDLCHLDTRYCNPQRMSSFDFSSCPMVSEIIANSFILTPKELPEPSDFMDILSSHVDLEETPQPSAIRAVLKRFINTISRVCQPHEPPQFYGGIIADPMGLGKTLTMISLVAMDMEPGREMCAPIDDIPTDKHAVAATLVIVPPPILGTWEQQIEDHVNEGALHYRRYHGKLRLALEELDTVNIVLTTYHTVAAEWKRDGGRRESLLFSVRWKRIVLDEGHFIRNGNSKMAVAICALEGISRWVVTGTPIQNRLGDLASLLKFIRAHPYTDPRRFDADISGLWKSGEDEDAVRRLKRLSACLLLRRAKSTINLPARQDVVYTVDFSAEERVAYERIKQQTIVRIDEALGQETGTRKSRGYVNVLQQIESLRLFSNLGLYYDSRHEKVSTQKTEAEEWNEMAQKAFNSQRVMASITCFQCASAFGLADTLLDDMSTKAGTAQYTSCLKYICSDCVDRLLDLGQTLPCGHTPPCQSAPVSTSNIALEEIDDPAPPQLRTAAVAPPSKIRSLVDDIKLSPPETKCVVFSTWRLTLDLVKGVLDQEGIQSIRFDGKVPQKDRQSVVKRFESDPNIRIMLLTLTCGAVGLTLTAACRAYLMEPHWNPTLEEQALARIHRLGQTKNVTTIRLYIRDSFEEQVMNVQESKKQLAGVLLSPQDSGYTDDNLGALEASFCIFL